MIKRVRAWLDYKARYEVVARECFDLTEQNIDLRKQFAASREQVERMMIQHDGAIGKIRAERDEAIHTCNTLQLKLDEALRPKLPPSDGAAKKPRASRAKPPMNE